MRKDETETIYSTFKESTKQLLTTTSRDKWKAISRLVDWGSGSDASKGPLQAMELESRVPEN